MTRMHVFDMDGTLLLGTTASIQIAKATGTLDQIINLEERLNAGLIDTRFFAKMIGDIWKDLTPTILKKAFDLSPWIGGLEKVFADIHQRGEKSVVITMSPDFFAKHLLLKGVDSVYASIFPPLPLKDPVIPDNILRPIDKVTIFKNLMDKYNIIASQCVAYGDSYSDIPLFEYMEKTISINAVSSLEDKSVLNYHGNDLFKAYMQARNLFFV